MCKRSNAGLKYCLILRSILSLRIVCVGVPCREAFYARFYADLQARVYVTASSHLVLIKAQSSASTSRLGDFAESTSIAKSVYLLESFESFPGCAAELISLCVFTTAAHRFSNPVVRMFQFRDLLGKNRRKMQWSIITSLASALDE